MFRRFALASCVPLILALAATVFAQVGSNLVFFPQVALITDSISTSFLVENPQDEAITVRLELFGSGGQVLDVNREIPASGSVRIDLIPDSEAPFLGWARLSSESQFNATEVFKIFDGSTLVDQVGVLPSGTTTSFKLFVNIANVGTAMQDDTGFALANPDGSLAANVSVRLKGANGTEQDVQNIAVPPLGHLPQFISELFGINSDFQGTVEVTSDRPIVALTLQSTENELAATPVLPFQTGTITSVNAGAGLMGGGSTGDITIELAPLIAPGGGGIDGQIGVRNAGNSVRAVMGIVDNTGVLGINNAAGNASAVITADNLGGLVQALNNDEDVAAELGVNVAGSGLVQVINNSGGGTPTDGVAVMTTTGAGAGFIGIRNPSAGRDLVRLTHLNNNSQVGVVAVFGQTGNEPIAGINGDTGDVFGQTKSFIVDDPTQEGRKIQYTSIEGPEAAIYVRGQVVLQSGRASVQFPPHFAALSVADSITITLTPRSAASLGVSAVSVSGEGFEVAELHSGTGRYPVDYVAYAVRKGYEDYQVYRDADDLSLPGSDMDPERNDPQE